LAPHKVFVEAEGSMFLSLGFFQQTLNSPKVQVCSGD